MITTPRLAMSALEFRALRRALKMTQEDLCIPLRLSLRQVKRYEKQGIPLRAALRADQLRQMVKNRRAGRKL